MSTVTSHEQVVDYEEYIDQQIVRTSFHVKTVDLVAGLIQLSLFLLLGLLVVVLIDHWLIGLEFKARLASLALFGGGGLYLLISRILRPVLQAINPAYAALAVERSFPSTKNAITSFLCFRDRPNELRSSIYAGLKQQAAVALTGIPIDSAVDRTPIIKLGYALVAVTAIWCAYILISPKSPFQTLQRILMPWRDIARPSQVEIVAVLPGSTEIFRGQTVPVKAEVHGLLADHQPWIEYSTTDGRVVAQRLPMSFDGLQGHYAGLLTTSDAGIHQDLNYRVVAGDAVSKTYDVLAKMAPHLFVDRLEYAYPAYTGLPNQVIEGFGDVRAIEGTRVTISARANQPVRSGYIELLTPPAEAAPMSLASKSKQAPLTVEGQHVTARFTLRMDGERTQSVFRAYRLHFTTAEGLPNLDPVEHTIDVTPDLRPIVELITPSRRTVEIPENGRQRIEVRALDPDFKLTRVVLAGKARGRALFRQELLSGEHTGQFTATFDFVPRDFELKAGEVVEYQAAAEDNRHAPLNGKLDPNRTVSWQQFLRIVEADPLVEQGLPANDDDPPGPTAPSQTDAKNPEGSDAGRQGDAGQQSDAAQQGAAGQQSDAGEQGDAAATQHSGSDEQHPQQQGQQDAAGQEESESGTSGQDSGLQQSGGSGTNAQRQELDSGQTGEASQQDSSTPGNGQQPTEPSGDGGGGPPGDGNDDSGTQDSQHPSDAAQNASARGRGASGSDGEQGDADADDKRLPSTGERDGEVIERIRRHLEENGEADALPEGSPEDTSGDADTQGAAQAEGPEDGRSASKTPDGQPGSRDATDGSSSSSEQTDASQGDAGAKPPKSTSQDGPGAATGSRGEQDRADAGQGQGETPRDSETAQATSDAEGQEAKRGEDAENPGTGGAEQAGTDRAPSTGENAEASNPRDSAGTSSAPDSRGREQSAQTDQGADPANQQGTAEKSNNADPSGAKQSDAGETSPAAGNGEKSPTGQGGAETTGPQEDAPPDSGAPAATPANGQRGATAADKRSGSTQKNASASPAGTSGSPGNQSDAADHGQTGGDLDGGTGSGDDANLEYTRQVTDLVLDYLQDQKRNPDAELLDKLGWDQADVDAFLRRWAEMKRQTEGRSGAAEQARKRLDDVLRNLKLEAPGGQTRASDLSKDQRRNIRNTGRRTRVPDELLDPFRAFQRSLQQSR